MRESGGSSREFGVNTIPNKDRYRIELDRKWKLEELNQYSRNYEQAYFAFFAVLSLAPSSPFDPGYAVRVSNDLARYPWNGGASVVSFYSDLRNTQGRKLKPDVAQIQYASPGFLDLILVPEIAKSVAGAVAAICPSLLLINKTYNDIYKGMRDRKLNEIDVARANLQLAAEQRAFLKDCAQDLGVRLGIQNVDQIVEASGNELRGLKVILSIYRRLRVLARYQNEGKAKLTEADEGR